MPEDGDFGIDFSEDGEAENITNIIDKSEPKIEFSVDKKGGSEDYYSEVWFHLRISFRITFSDDR